MDKEKEVQEFINELNSGFSEITAVLPETPTIELKLLLPAIDKLIATLSLIKQKMLEEIAKRK